MARLCNSPGYNLFSHGKHANNGSFEVGLRQDEDEESELGLDSLDRLPVCSLVRCGVGLDDGERGGVSVGFRFLSVLLLGSSKGQGRWPCWESWSPELMHSPWPSL